MVINAWGGYFGVVVSSCWLTRNIVPHIFAWRTTSQIHEEIQRFAGMELFLFSPQKFAIRTWFCNCPQSSLISRCRWVQPQYTWSRKDGFSQIDFFIEHIPHPINIFFPTNFMSSTHTDKKNLFSRCTKRHSQLEFFPSHVSTRFSQTAFPMIFLPKGDRTDSFREERLDLPYLTMIQAICFVVDESKCMYIQILEFSLICEHLPFSLGNKLTLRQLLVHRNLAIWRWCPWCSCCHLRCWRSLFSEYCVRPRIVFYDIGSECNSTFIFEVLCLQFSIFQMTYVH